MLDSDTEAEATSVHEPATSRQNRRKNRPQNDRQNDRRGDRQRNRNPESRRTVYTTGRRSSPPVAQRTGWNTLTLVREATVGALQALAIIASFVVVGLGWAILADASQLARDSITRYRGDVRNPSFEDRPETHCAKTHYAKTDYAKTDYAKTDYAKTHYARIAPVERQIFGREFKQDFRQGSRLPCDGGSLR